MTGPDITPLIDAFRATMQDGCTITRPADPGQTPDLDPDTGQPVTQAETLIYVDGDCTVADPATGRRQGRTSVDDAGVPNQRILRLPVDSPDALPGDLVEMTRSRFSPSLVGDRFVVQEERERSYSTHRRYVVQGAS